MDKRDKLIVSQQLEIQDLKAFKESALKDFREINLMLVCVGGPLNDNVLGYSREQRQPLHKINGIVTSYNLED